VSNQRKRTRNMPSHATALNYEIASANEKTKNETSHADDRRVGEDLIESIHLAQEDIARGNVVSLKHFRKAVEVRMQDV